MYKRRLSLLAFLLGTIGSLAGTCAFAGDLDEVTSASDRARSEISRALKEADGARLSSVFCKDGAIIAPTGQTITGRFTIRVTAGLLLPAIGDGDLSVTRLGLTMIDSLAYETGRYVWSELMKDKSRRNYTGRYVVIWQKEDGAWKASRAIAIP